MILNNYYLFIVGWVAQSVYRPTMGWKVQDRMCSLLLAVVECGRATVNVPRTRSVEWRSVYTFVYICGVQVNSNNIDRINGNGRTSEHNRLYF